jgi:hypothetical protein
MRNNMKRCSKIEARKVVDKVTQEFLENAESLTTGGLGGEVHVKLLDAALVKVGWTWVEFYREVLF